MRIRKGWSKGVHRYLGTILADGGPCYSRSVLSQEGGRVRYTLEIHDPEDGHSTGVELNAEEVLRLVLTAPAIAAADASMQTGVDYKAWLQMTKVIIGHRGGGRPCDS